MIKLNNVFNIRTTERTAQMIEEILKEFPNLYRNSSDIFRCAVLRFHREKLPHSKIQQEILIEEKAR